MIESDYNNILREFGIEETYNKDQLISGLEEIGIIKKGKGLISKIKSELALRKTYSNGTNELQFMYIDNLKSYRVVTWNKSP